MARIGACVLISIDGTSLTCAGVADAASGRATVRVDPAAFERAEAAAALARKLAAQHPVKAGPRACARIGARPCQAPTRAPTVCGCCAATRAAAAR